MENDNENPQTKIKTQLVIRDPKTTSNPSFSQSFSFVKQSEFYTPPPTLPENTPQIDPIRSTLFDSERLIEHSEISLASTSSSSIQNRNAILVSHRQKGNPLLKHIRNVRWNFADVVCDYLVGQNSCALYLSLRYHLLHPDYLYYRIRELQKNFKIRVVLCHVDVEDVVKPLHEVTRTALLHDCTLLCAWSLEECGRYLETMKVYENKSPDIIQGQMDTDYLSRLNNALTTVRRVNKTDVVTLGSTFGSLSNIMDASIDDLAHCPGIGERKVKRLYDTFHEPFKRIVSSHSYVPEASTQNSGKPSTSSKEAEKNDMGGKKRKKNKEPELTVKSAISAVFAKYSDKLSGKRMRTKEDEGGDCSTARDKEDEKSIEET